MDINNISLLRFSEEHHTMKFNKTFFVSVITKDFVDKLVKSQKYSHPNWISLEFYINKRQRDLIFNLMDMESRNGCFHCGHILKPEYMHMVHLALYAVIFYLKNKVHEQSNSISIKSVFEEHYGKFIDIPVAMYCSNCNRVGGGNYGTHNYWNYELTDSEIDFDQSDVGV